MLNDKTAIKGYAVLEVVRDGKNGPEVIQRIETNNLVVNTGKQQVLRKACGLNTKDFDKFRLGTSGVVAASADTNVKSPVAGSLTVADSKSLLSGTRSLQLSISYPSGVGSLSASSIQELAILNEITSPGGHALSRAVFATAVNKTTADVLKLTYTLRVT